MAAHTPLVPNTPTTFVIFGVTGDLSKRKLIPALFNLYINDYLPPTFRIVGFSKDDFTASQFKQYVRGIIEEKHSKPDTKQLEEFLLRLSYQQGLFEDGQSYLKLSEGLIKLENKTFGKCSNKLYYLAVPPMYYETIFQNLAHSGLTIPCGGADGWTRVLVEKPFGHDLKTAQELDRKLGLLFKEEQIFRIDHYLAKETLQNIVAFRFSNSLFEPLWNKDHIEKVEIKVWEELGVGSRGEFYEDVGALRDVGQNHMLQMLALIAMEDPDALSAAAIRQERAKVLQTLQPLTAAEIKHNTIRGQYTGYRDEQNVAAASHTETFFRIQAQLTTPRWAGVPFYLESGKKLKESKVEISIFFKQIESCLSPIDDPDRHQNVLTFHIQPNEGISIVFWAKKPGFGNVMELEGRKLSFSYQGADDVLNLPDAYEHVLFDCIRGDQTLFTSTQEVSAAWEFITPIVTGWQQTPLLEYEPGTKGPMISTKPPQ